MKKPLFVVLFPIGVIAAFFAGYMAGSPSAVTMEAEPPTATNVVETAAKTNDLPADASSSVEAASPAVTNVPPEMSVKKVVYDGQSMLKVYLSERPDMEVARRFVSVGPMNQGTFGCSFSTEWYWGDREKVLKITGDFAFRTNLTLRIRQGLPIEGRELGALAEDFVYRFRRKDAPPVVKFVASGRYLPPMGQRQLEIEALNVTNVLAEVRRVEPRNVVQLLAREERVYQSYWRNDVDTEDTEELSGECENTLVPCRNLPNRKESHRIAVKMNDGGPANGMYLVMVRNSDLERNDCRWSGRYTPNVYRVVCVSDLGLSVRRCDDGLGVWVTSLTTGRPVADAKVEVYSSSNTKIAEGTSEANGWCMPTSCAKGDPFAVVVRSASGDDMTFMALRDSMRVAEDVNGSARQTYLKSDECTAFLWSERGIYRHDEKIFIHGLFRNGAGKAPKPMPVELVLRSSDGKEISKCSVMTDEDGAIVCDGFSVPAERPSGVWTILAKVPGGYGRVFGSRSVKVEEFAPPQIRVRIAADEAQHPSNLTFRISAEHLFGGPARQLDCEGAVVFEDVPFSPARWKGWSFGNETRGLKPCFRTLSQRVLDEKGECVYSAPIFKDSGLPKAAVKATVQGTVFEDGGRPATSRKSMVCHYYPYYIGSDLGAWMKLPASGPLTLAFALVAPDGEPVAGIHSLTARLERIDSVYTYQRNDRGEYTWDCNRVNTEVVPGAVIMTDADGRASYELPTGQCGDYRLTVADGTGASFSKSFYLSCWGDDVVRASLSDPTAVSVTTDKPFYRVGEVPRLLVKSPFAGWTMMTVMRDKEMYHEIVNLTNATSEIVMRPVTKEWSPNVDVYLSVVQSVSENTKHLAARAHGQTTVSVRPIENEIKTTVGAEVRGESVEVEVEAQGAAYAVVTLVDEGINLLTEEKAPDPIAYFARPCRYDHPLYDIFGRILPVVDENLRVNGVKTGGGFGAEMLGRVSPQPTRRFKPLALWKSRVPLRNGRGHVRFEIPEFVGEVRITAVAYSDYATGSASVQKKVAPNLIMQPDGPRFVAPGDEFTVTMPLRNMTKTAGRVDYEISAQSFTLNSSCVIPPMSMTNVVATIRAPKSQGELAVRFVTRGLGEAHKQTIRIPVRPAYAWRETTGVARVEDEASLRAALKEGERFAVKRCQTPTDELVSAYRWLADYPHGCLEQTSSRIFPLLSGGLGVVSNREEYVTAGVRRVESMIRENNFVMWPDCDYAPWDDEVSLYASHFLIEAERSGVKLAPRSKEKVLKFLAKWAMVSNDCVSAYACHDLALAGKPDRDRMLRLYDRAEKLNALTRARLARAFALDHDFKRAEKLLSYAYDPQNIREAAFTVLAMLEIDPDDPRIFPIVEYLMKNRVGSRFHWGTTGENAHALLAIGAYYRAHPGKEKEPYLLWRKLTLPEVNEVQDDSSGIFIDRKYFHANGESADLNDLVRGEMLIVKLSITTDVSRVVNDLVIEDLFPAAFEPVLGDAARGVTRHTDGTDVSRATCEGWVMRSDARDDRMLVFSKRFNLEKGNAATFEYPVRVVTAGDFVLPGPSVEGMYNPRLHSRRAPGRIVVRH